ncbi:heparinase II/III family protein [Lentisalinibacter sediminis]|uniref:heparinase II/III family protein n=1 Tax=Lentisalinibacter sediminis TaxID=2992237 RepID=UPI003870189B
MWHEDLLCDWVLKNPPGQGCGWEPYPTSLRVVNWIKWALAGNDLPSACAHSLAVQARWLSRRLEFHLLGNHLFANAKALIFAGLYFDGVEAEKWLQTGFRILGREVEEQILSDGGHFERSTMYHALAVEDMLDLSNLVACFQGVLDRDQQDHVRRWRSIVGDMLRWLHLMCHPDGEIAFFNDAALGIAPSVSELDAYADRLGIPRDVASNGMTWLAHSGYARLERDDAVLLADAAPIGPDYLPGHAHADTLSFELSLFGRRVIVNSGTSCYGSSKERLRQRGTAAHNTVVIDGENSSEVWGGFRVARRARPVAPELTDGEDGVMTLSCSHNGYQRLPGSPSHRRRWELHSRSLTVKDYIDGSNGSAEARYHLHPGVKVEAGPSGLDGRGYLPNGRAFSWIVDEGSARIEPSSWHPRFGESQSSMCIVVQLKNSASIMRLTWD